jgi:hypothetical protein
MFVVVTAVIKTSDDAHWSYAMIASDDHGAHNMLQNCIDGIVLERGGARSLHAAREICSGSVLLYLRYIDTQARPSYFALPFEARTIFFDEKSRDITSYRRRIFPTASYAPARHDSKIHAPTPS